ncbi:GntR family transcriptional regulator [Tomitella gaofuii]|uniref:GntR family transcriptional regulator n=1 Tax=Tomitella gaofuii TaxID=2760083 RepID=UPI0015FD99F3|nr:GntR family transcriptional regulator [Tomitella gaofuii]
MNNERNGPRYYLVKESLEQRIADLDPHTPISTERALALEFGTSRTTVRQAVTELVAEGRLIRVHGSGTFVAPPKHTYVRQLTSFSQDADAQGRGTRSRIIAIERVAPDADARAAMGLTAREKVCRIERVRLLDEIPHAHEIALVAGRFPRLPSMITEEASLYEILTDRFGVRIVEAEDSVETALAGPDDAATLGIEVGAPLLLVQRLATDEQGRHVEFTRSRFRGDRARFVARLRI